MSAAIQVGFGIKIIQVRNSGVEWLAGRKNKISQALRISSQTNYSSLSLNNSVGPVIFMWILDLQRHSPDKFSKGML